MTAFFTAAFTQTAAKSDNVARKKGKTAAGANYKD
jgi:hypothetical protein